MDVPSASNDLTDPALAGQVAIAHPAARVIPPALFTQVLRLGGEDEPIAYAREDHQNVLGNGLRRGAGRDSGPRRGRRLDRVQPRLRAQHRGRLHRSRGFSFPRRGTSFSRRRSAHRPGAPEPNRRRRVDELGAPTRPRGSARTASLVPAATRPDAAVGKGRRMKAWTRGRTLLIGCRLPGRRRGARVSDPALRGRGRPARPRSGDAGRTDETGRRAGVPASRSCGEREPGPGRAAGGVPRSTGADDRPSQSQYSSSSSR